MWIVKNGKRMWKSCHSIWLIETGIALDRNLDIQSEYSKLMDSMGYNNLEQSRTVVSIS